MPFNDFKWIILLIVMLLYGFLPSNFSLFDFIYICDIIWSCGWKKKQQGAITFLANEWHDQVHSMTLNGHWILALVHVTLRFLITFFFFLIGYVYMRVSWSFGWGKKRKSLVGGRCWVALTLLQSGFFATTKCHRKIPKVVTKKLLATTCTCNR